MQICLFEVVNEVVVPDSSTYLIPWLKAIRDGYPKDYLRVYAYLFYMSCWDGRNIYINKPMDEREQMIVEQLGIDFSLESDVIVYALDKCKELYETPMVKVFKTIKRKIDGICDFLDENEITSGKNGNAMDTKMFMKELPGLVEDYDKIGEKLRKEQSKVFGSKKLAYDQKPKQQ